ncbi:CMP-N,N'-diacetyllegionaminic acid synthase [bioreactor metagenome]|uniref:CMP-N,N'-diacetyllegionaminic acid synthase n=1 Tax=bioreactor metagenome TaxID=1076179 RepID=A0A644ZG80_9ZZZZ|nr:acylneuraminate cytidylyltransferase family protein [Candidatus Pelethousia sp.]
MRLLFTICGRAGSKGLKNKNLKVFMGAPLVYYTLAAIIEYKKTLSSMDIVDVALNTDSENLVELVCMQKELSVFPIRRAENLAGDSVPKVEVIQDCLVRSVAHFQCTYDVVVDLDITSPLRTANDIRKAVEMKIKRIDTDAIYSVTSSRRNPYFNMVQEQNGFSSVAIPSAFTARQQAPAIYDMNGSIYAYSPHSLMSKNSIGFFNSNCYFITMKDTAVLDIDSEEDFELLQIIAKYIFDAYPAFDMVRSISCQLAATIG